jgi:hypothetical protein
MGIHSYQKIHLQKIDWGCTSLACVSCACLIDMYLMGVYHGMQPVLLSRTYVFAAFDGRWPGVAFLISR